MTSRERVLTALRHAAPDCVPVAMTSSGFVRKEASGTDALARFLKQTGLPDYEAALRRLHADVRWVDASKALPRRIERLRLSLRTAETARDVERCFQIPLPDPWEWTPDALWADIRRAREDGYAVMIYPVVDFYETAAELRGQEQFWMDLLTDLPIAEAILDGVLALSLQRAERLLSEFGQAVDLVGNCDDFGHQDRLQMAPDIFRKAIAPRLKHAVALEKRHTDAFIFHHTCGAVKDIVPDLIGAGINVLNPVQVSAKGMDISALKREYGKDLCFYGGIDIQHVCPRGTVSDVADHVRRTIEVLGDGGGYILSPTHAIGSDVSAAKVLTIFDTARQCGPTQ